MDEEQKTTDRSIHIYTNKKVAIWGAILLAIAFGGYGLLYWKTRDGPLFGESSKTQTRDSGNTGLQSPGIQSR